MELSQAEIERLIRAAGYDPEARVAVGVSLPSGAPAYVAHGLQADDLAYAGSLAKQVTGACAALLVQDGALAVEDPVGAWLTGLPGWAQTVRVRHLLHHTAGLPGTDTVWQRMQRAGETDWTSDGVITALSTMPDLEHDPGAAYAYSNVGYVCLARILERLSGLSLDHLARARLFEPLQMRDTILWSGPQASPPHAALVQPFRPPAPLSIGDGGLWTTVRDLVRWNDALLADILGITTVLHTPGALDDGTPLDYAWGVRAFRHEGDRVESHGGSWEGATAKLVRLPDSNASFAVLALDGSVERMIALSSALQGGLPRNGRTTGA